MQCPVTVSSNCLTCHMLSSGDGLLGSTSFLFDYVAIRLLKLSERCYFFFLSFEDLNCGGYGFGFFWGGWREAACRGQKGFSACVKCCTVPHFC